MVRAGTRALSIFTNALDARVLHAHAEGPLRPRDLEETLGWAPQSSLRAAIVKMRNLGALIRDTESPAGASTELSAAGRGLLPVADALEKWLEDGPGGPLPLDDPAAQGIVRVLTAGWDSTIIRALAERPQTLIGLSAEIADLNYPALKRRFAKLRSTHLAAPVATRAGTAYVASDWLRRSVVPLTYAGRWERKHDVEAEPISRVEVEAAFLLALPLATMPNQSVGTCSLAVLTAGEKAESKQDVAGVAVEVKQGSIVSCKASATSPPTWALGTVDAWLEALVDGRSNALRISGTKPRLARSIVKSIHDSLFGS